MRTLLFSLILITGFAMGQSVITYGANYTNAAGEQRSINLIPDANGQFTLVDARADGMDQQIVTIPAPNGSEAVIVKLSGSDVRLTKFSDSYTILVRPDMPPVELKRIVSNP